MKNIAVHNGPFHADDVFAIAILKLIYPKLEVVRTRDEAILKKSDARIDVGREYNPEKGGFDHHQKGGAGKRENGIPYASAGLIWKNFGEKLANKDTIKYLDERMIQYIDADDNGVDVGKSTIPIYSISEFIEGMNPSSGESSHDEFDKRFFEVVGIIMKLLSGEIKRADIICKSREIVKNKIKESNGDYIILEEKMPWKDAVIKESKLKFVIMYNKLEKNWGISAVPVSLDSFENRMSLPREWRGLDNQALENACGINGAVFCHNSGHMAINLTKEGAIKMVEKALKNHSK